MPRRNQHVGTSEPLLATIGRNTETDLAVVTEMFEGGDKFITVDSFMHALVLNDEDSGAYAAAETAGEAEHRLRQLTARGWLYMSAYRTEGGVFVEYRWVKN